MKYVDIYCVVCADKSHPVRGAWIEILVKDKYYTDTSTSHPVRGAWIEMYTVVFLLLSVVSHPVRGAWIEIKRPGL